MNAEQIESAGYMFRYHKHYGRTVRVTIERKRDGALVCTHWHTQGVVGAFNRIWPGQHGRMTLEEENAAVTA